MPLSQPIMKNFDMNDNLIVQRIFVVCNLIVLGIALGLMSGCSTLASLGLPVGNPSHQILDSAKSISETPAFSLQQPNELLKQPLETYFIEIGDTVFVEPVSFDATIRLPGDQVVKPDGTISIGEFGSLDAFNKTVDQLQLEVQAIIDSRIRADLELAFAEEARHEASLHTDAERPKLEGSSDREAVASDEQAHREEERDALERRIAERIKKNSVSVRLVNWESKRIYVLGEVNSPGYFPYTGNQTVLDAIVEAGGLSTKANQHQMIVSRPTPCGSCRIVMKVCYDQVVQLGDSSTNYQLLPGDRVFVPSLTFSEDLKRSFSFGGDPHCPRCAPQPQGCVLPEGCAY